MPRISIRIKEDLLNRLKADAANSNIEFSDYIRSLLERQTDEPKSQPVRQPKPEVVGQTTKKPPVVRHEVTEIQGFVRQNKETTKLSDKKLSVQEMVERLNTKHKAPVIKFPSGKRAE